MTYFRTKARAKGEKKLQKSIQMHVYKKVGQHKSTLDLFILNIKKLQCRVFVVIVIKTVFGQWRARKILSFIDFLLVKNSDFFLLQR